MPITFKLFFWSNFVSSPRRSSWPGACFSKVPKRFGPISGATIAFIPSQSRGSKHSNFAILLIFLILKTCKKITFSRWAYCSLTTSFSGPKSSWDFRETGPWPRLFKERGRLPRFALKIRLEWNACNGTGFSWLTLNRSAGPRLTLLAVSRTILLCYDFYTHKSLFSAALRHKEGQTDSQNWLFTYLCSPDLGTRRCFAKLLHTPCVAILKNL